MTTVMNRARMWLRAMFTRRSEDHELAREMESHIAMERDNLIRQGVERGEADRRARVAFGGVQRHTEAVRDERGTRFFDALWQDVRYAFRQYARAPWIALTVVVTLAFGLGASSWLFIVTEYYSPRVPAAVAADRDLVRVRGMMVADRSNRNRALSYDEIAELRARTDVFASVAGVTERRYVAMSGVGDGAWQIRAQFVTSGFLGLLGVQPQFGSALAADDDKPGAASVFISDRLWRRAFASRADVVGTTVRIGYTTATIVGVAPRGFKAVEGMEDFVDAWLPLASFPAVAGPGRESIQRTAGAFSVVAALRPGVSIDRATAAAQSVGAGAAARYTRGNVTTSSDIAPLRTTNGEAYSNNNDAAIFISTLAALALLVLAIVGTNVSALMLGRSAARRREIGVRVSLGATRSRLIRQLLTESVILGIAAGVLGLGAMVVALRFVNQAVPDEPVFIGWLTVAGTAAISLGVGLVCGLSPALHATRASIADVVKGSIGGTPRQARSQRRLIVAQIALSQPLLVGLVVMVVAMFESERGSFDDDATRQVLVFGLSPAELSPLRRDSARGLALGQQALTTLVGAPGVERVAIGARWTRSADFQTIADGAVQEQSISARLQPVGPDYFAVMGGRIIRGREFADTDVPGAPNALIVASDFARAYFGDADPVGRRLVCPEDCPAKEYTIVGVIDTVALGATLRDNGRARVYFPAAQADRFSEPTLYVRVRGDAVSLVPVLRSRLAQQFPNTPIDHASTFASLNDNLQRENGQMGFGAGAAGLVTLLLAAVGLYGVVSFAVNQRTREIGVRIALGATSGGVIRHFFRDGVRLSVIGCVIGLPVSVFAVRAALPAQEVQRVNTWLVAIGVTVVVTAMALLATWIPARRAARVDPLVALRAE